MTNNVKQLLQEAIFYDQYFLAYSVFIAVRKGIVSMEDSEEVFFNSKLPFDEIKAAENADSLLLKKNSVKLFMVKMNQDYAMYLGKDQGEVERLHYRLFKEPAERIINATNKKRTTLYDPDTKKTYSFYDLQERTKIYPCYCGLIESKAS